MKAIQLNKANVSAAIVAASRRASYLAPQLKITVIHSCDMGWWEEVCRAVRLRCRLSYERWGHCENPFPVGDLRRWEWVQETQAIVRERLQLVLLNTRWAEDDAVCDLGAAKPGEVVPFPIPPAPVPEEEQEPDGPEEVPAAAKKKVNWECEEAYV